MRLPAEPSFYIEVNISFIPPCLLPRQMVLNPQKGLSASGPDCRCVGGTGDGGRCRGETGRGSVWSAQPLSASLGASSVKDTVECVTAKYHTREPLVSLVWLCVSVCLSHKAEGTAMFSRLHTGRMFHCLCQDFHSFSILFFSFSFLFFYLN